MKISEFVFHGVPQGFDVWGTSDDKYYESFYSNLNAFKEATPVFVVEIRKDSNRWCAYYTYIRSQNFIAESGRTGSYFGMSLKMSGEYCTDVYSLFSLMDTIYEKKVVGKIVVKNGSGEKFIVPTFAAASKDLEDISKLFTNQLQSNFEGDFYDIEPSLSKKNASTSVRYNVNDVNSESFFNATKEYGKIFISEVYPSKDTIIANFESSDKRYQTIKTEYEGQIESLKKDNRQIPELKSKVASLSQEFQKVSKRLQGKVDSLQRELCSVKQENEKLKRSSKAGGISEKFESKLSEILSLLKAMPGTPPPTPRNLWQKIEAWFKKRFPDFLALFAIAVVFFFLFQYPIISNLNKSLTELVNIQQKCTELENENQSLMSELEIEKARNHLQDSISTNTAKDKKDTKDSSDNMQYNRQQ